MVHPEDRVDLGRDAPPENISFSWVAEVISYDIPD